MLEFGVEWLHGVVPLLGWAREGGEAELFVPRAPTPTPLGSQPISSVPLGSVRSVRVASIPHQVGTHPSLTSVTCVPGPPRQVHLTQWQVWPEGVTPQLLGGS